jgi:myo-inositol-1(or 4)-monophosphatase
MTDRFITDLNLAMGTAREAGRYLIKSAGVSRDIIEEKERDVHFQFDLESEKIIIDSLQRASNYKMITEESGVIDAAGGDYPYIWLVDPLDGSINYSEAIPFSCISISLWQDASPILGVIYDFNRDHMYTGVVGMGAWMNNQAISVKPYRSSEKAILCTGFPSAMDFSEEALHRFIGRVKQFRKIRMLGSAALSLACVASGKVDAYYEKNIKIWDVAAGLAIVKAAGGDIVCEGFPESYLAEVFGGTSLELFHTMMGRLDPES